MQIEENVYLDFSDVLIKPKRSSISSRKDVSLIREFSFPHAKTKITGIPIIAANLDSVGTISTAIELAKKDIYCALHKHYPVEELVSFFSNKLSNKTFYTMGSSESDLEKFATFNTLSNNDYPPLLCIDVANGYSQKFVSFVKSMREMVGDGTVIMAGNVATPEMTEELILNGADIVKVGIGSGAQCTTRIVAGVGVPQLSCAISCSDAAHGLGGTICSDGGIITPADASKAFGAGADFVMMGSALAGHDESEGEEVRNEKGEITGKIIYGMSSSTAMKKYSAPSEYRSSEGRTSIVPYRGKISDTINYFCGGIRSSMTYVGASNIKQMSKRTTFIRVNNIINDTYKNSTTTIS